MVANLRIKAIDTGCVGRLRVRDVVRREHGGGTCSGDSGGPNFIGTSNVVGGVTSFGTTDTCKGHNGAYRVDQPDDLSWLATFGLTPLIVGRLRRRRRAASGRPFSLLVRDRAAAGLGRVALLVRAVRRAHERAGEHRAEPERLALLAEPAELVGVHPAVDRPRASATGWRYWPIVTTSTPCCAQVAHRLDDLVVRLAEADDDPGLRQHVVDGELLRPLAGARAPCRSSPSRRACARAAAAPSRCCG